MEPVIPGTSSGEEETDQSEEAECHHAENHEGDDWSGGDGFYPEHYEPDPNGSIQRLRERNGRTERTEVDRGDGPRADGGEDRFTDCEECGEPVDMLKAGVWKAPNDEQWWHEDCYDKVEKAEELAERIRNLMVPEGEFDGLSNDFHDQLDAAQGYIETAVERERLKRDQGIAPYDTGMAQDGGRDE